MQAFCSGLVVLFFAGCTEVPKVKTEPDPFLQSFWGRNISSMSKRYCKDDSCTNFHDHETVYSFDQNGNIIEENTGIDVWRYEFNDQHFMVRYFYVWDTYVNESYVYHLDENNKILYRYCYPIDSREWDFNKADVDSAKMYVVKYKFNSMGMIEEKIDTFHTLTTKYFYESDLLVKKQLVRREEIREEWNYKYLNGRIKQMEHSVPSVPGEITNYYFSDTGDLLFSKNFDMYSRPHIVKYFFTYRDSVSARN